MIVNSRLGPISGSPFVSFAFTLSFELPIVIIHATFASGGKFLPASVLVFRSGFRAARASRDKLFLKLKIAVSTSFGSSSCAITPKT